MSQREVTAALENGPQGFSIRVASKLTGIASDTLRIWERRYDFPKPMRNSSHVRMYTNADIERLVWVARAIKAGFRAGEVIRRSAEELRGLVANATHAEFEKEPNTPTVEHLLDHLVRDDPDGLRDELRRSVTTLGPKRFLTDVAGPLLESVGQAWAAGRIAVRHEHLLSDILSSKLRLLLSAYEDQPRGPVVLLCTLPDEQHSLGLEMVALYLALEGMTPRIVGPNTPPDQIVAAAQALSAQVVGVSISESSEVTITEAHLRHVLASISPGTVVWAGGKRASDLSLRDPQLYRVVTWCDLDQAIATLRATR